MIADNHYFTQLSQVMRTLHRNGLRSSTIGDAFVRGKNFRNLNCFRHQVRLRKKKLPMARAMTRKVTTKVQMLVTREVAVMLYL